LDLIYPTRLKSQQPYFNTQPNRTFFSFFHLDFHLEVLGYTHLVGNPTQTPIAQNPETPDGNPNGKMKKKLVFIAKFNFQS
jgi:hypothetical protein